MFFLYSFTECLSELLPWLGHLTMINLRPDDTGGADHFPLTRADATYTFY
ncbi:hypothetical protein VCSRO26_3491 [Vibrio cholerae]|nr:hypothetical protein VCSRO26_3491 [Vibrio cholerae]